VVVVQAELSIDEGEVGRLMTGDAIRLEAGTTFAPFNAGLDLVETVEASTLPPLSACSSGRP